MPRYEDARAYVSRQNAASQRSLSALLQLISQQRDQAGIVSSVGNYLNNKHREMVPVHDFNRVYYKRLTLYGIWSWVMLLLLGVGIILALVRPPAWVGLGICVVALAIHSILLIRCLDSDEVTHADTRNRRMLNISTFITCLAGCGFGVSLAFGSSVSPLIAVIIAGGVTYVIARWVPLRYQKYEQYEKQEIAEQKWQTFLMQVSDLLRLVTLDEFESIRHSLDQQYHWFVIPK